MSRMGFKIMVTVASFIFIGGLIGQQIHHSMWTGALVGGLLGYFGFAFSEVKHAIKTVIHRSGQMRVPKALKSIRLYGNLSMTVLLGGLWLTTFFLLNVEGMRLGIWDVTGRFISHNHLLTLSFIVLMMIAFMAGLASIVMGTLFACMSKYRSTSKRIATMLGLGNPIVAPFYVLYKAFPSMCMFVVAVTKLIYSSERLLVCVNAAIGAAVGSRFHSLGSLAYCAIIGGILGGLQYEFISIRLGLVSQPQ